MNNSEIIQDINKVEIKKEITVAAARETLLKEKQDRQMVCTQEIALILKKYNCDIFALPMFTKEGTIIAQSRIIAKE